MRQGGQSRHRGVARIGLALAAISVVALAVTPLAMAGSPAQDEYQLNVPSGGNGSSSEPSSGTPSGAAQVTPDTTATPTTSGSGDTGGTGTGSGSGSKSNGSNNSANGGGGSGSNLDAPPAPVVATHTANDGGVPVLLIVLLGIAALGGFYAYWRRRRTVSA
jgi:hypothetical protein